MYPIYHMILQKIFVQEQSQYLKSRVVGPALAMPCVWTTKHGQPRVSHDPINMAMASAHSQWGLHQAKLGWINLCEFTNLPIRFEWNLLSFSVCMINWLTKCWGKPIYNHMNESGFWLLSSKGVMLIAATPLTLILGSMPSFNTKSMLWRALHLI